MMNNLLCKTDCHGHCRQWGLLILRVVIGAIFISHGYGKLTGSPSLEMFSGMLGGMGIPAPMFFAWVVALTELLGGIALVLGIFVKPAAYLLAFVMLVALGKVKGFAIFGKGEIDFALLGATLAIAMMGSGKYALAPHVCGCCKDGTCSTEKADEMKKS
ncbi:MAG: DoxX family protein [Candidatus Magasanikbacteria bacterium]|nr:DoxX family protein [Candidatus Magasanikbacteria bacterium]